MEERNLKVTMIHSTQKAERLLAFAKNTRLLGSNDNNIFSRPMDEVMKDVEYSMSTIRGPLEFIHYVFLIENASRAMTHQLVRHRVNSYAQQSLRVSDNFNYYIPKGIKCDEVAKKNYEDHMLNCEDEYFGLESLGVDMQDARGVLPLHTTSAILVKMNLRAALELFETRFCLRAQGEFQEAAKQMADLIQERHSWTKPYIGPHCLVHSNCLFPRFDQCPISKAVPELRGISSDRKTIIDKIWKHNIGKGIQPTHINSDDQEAYSIWGDGEYVYLTNHTGDLHPDSVDNSGNKK